MKKFLPIAALVLILSACGASTSTDVTQTQSATIVNMESANMFFKPNTLALRKGEKTTINFKNTGFHTFVLEEFDVNVDLKGKTEGSVTFTPDKVGTFEYFCDVPGHREAGMKGTLTVVE